MARNKKGFNAKLCAAVVCTVIAVALVVICAAVFLSGPTAADPEELAKTYVDTIVKTGDGYNAYKYTLVTKNAKHSDFIKKHYVDPFIYRDTGFEVGDSTDGLTGYNDKSYKGENTLTDDGSLEGQVADAMYPYYKNLMQNVGWDEYDVIYNSYLQRLSEIREEIFGDKYLTEEIFFTAIEANVASYGKSLTGTEDEFDKKTGEQTGYKTIGAYADAYGEAYEFSVFIAEVTEINLEEYKAYADITAFETYGVSIDEIAEVQSVLAEVKDVDGGIVTEAEVVVVKIGDCWYVDNTATDTTPLYNFYLI